MTRRSNEYAAESGDPDFAVFMHFVDTVVTRRLGVSVFDFADADWWSLYDEEVGPDDVMAVLAKADPVAAHWARQVEIVVVR